MTTARTWRNQEDMADPAGTKYIDNRVWTGTRSAAEQTERAPTPGATAPIFPITHIRQQSIAVPQANSTSLALQNELLRESDLVTEFGHYVLAARNERFEDGMSSTFAHCVHESIRKHSRIAVNAWERVLLRYDNAYETGEELLRQLGLLEHVPSHDVRLHVLIDNLNSSDPRIRDAAGLGLSFLDDPQALAPLREAWQSETEPWLREGLKLVIEQLEALA